MPEYRKKRRNKLFSAPKKAKGKKTYKNKNNDIKMTPEKRTKSAKADINMKVVRGRKEERKKRAKLWACVLLCLCVIAAVFEMILPAGIVQTASNSLALIGTGNYPIELESTDTLSVEARGSYYYVLSSTELTAFSNSGKKLYTHTHGFEKPILKTSEWGALLFNQGDNKVLIFDLKKLKDTVTAKNTIINADISDSGAYALVTKTEGYASAVSVYSKYGKELYEWYSAEDTVNNVAVASNDKKIAVSTFSVENGEYKSRVAVLNFKSATPEFSVDYSGSLIYSLSCTATGRFTVATSVGVDFIKWKKNDKTEYKNDYNIALLREASHGTVAVFNRESDPTDAKIAVFSKRGELKYEFGFKGIISDIRLFGGHIYCMSDTEIHLIDQTGKILSSTPCGFGGVRMVVTGSNTAAVITDNKIEKIKISTEEK